MPFVVKLTSRPRRLRYRSDSEELREEQGGLWWNVGHELDCELDPVDTETELRTRARVPGQPAGETPDEWRARGNIVRIMPPGKAYVL